MGENEDVPRGSEDAQLKEPTPGSGNADNNINDQLARLNAEASVMFMNPDELAEFAEKLQRYKQLWQEFKTLDAHLKQQAGEKIPESEEQEDIFLGRVGIWEELMKYNLTVEGIDDFIQALDSAVDQAHELLARSEKEKKA